RVEVGVHGGQAMIQLIQHTDGQQPLTEIEAIESSRFSPGLQEGLKLLMAGRIHVAVMVPHIDVVRVEIEEQRIGKILEQARLHICVALPYAPEALAHHEVPDADATGDTGVAVAAIRTIEMSATAAKTGGDQSAVERGTELLGGIHEYGRGDLPLKIAAGMWRCLIEAQ